MFFLGVTEMKKVLLFFVLTATMGTVLGIHHINNTSPGEYHMVNGGKGRYWMSACDYIRYQTGAELTEGSFLGLQMGTEAWTESTPAGVEKNPEFIEAGCWKDPFIPHHL